MHERAKGFCEYLADIFDKFMVRDTPEEPTEPTDLSIVSKVIRGYMDDKATYKNVQFGILGIVCNNTLGRTHVSTFRNLNEDPEARSVYIAKFRTNIENVKKFISVIDETKDEDLDAILKKISLYFHLFTRMYFQ